MHRAERRIRLITAVILAILVVAIAWSHAGAADRPFKFATWGSTPTGAADFYHGVSLEKG
jgi:hypothetical protein